MSDIIATVEYEEYSTPIIAYENYVQPTVVDAIGIQGVSATNITLAAIQDVDSSLLVNGSVLVYKTNTNKWTATTTFDAQNVEGGEF